MVGVSTDCVVIDGVAIVDGWILNLVCSVVVRKSLFSGVPIALGVSFLHQ